MRRPTSAAEELTISMTHFEIEGMLKEKKCLIYLSRLEATLLSQSG